MRNRKLFALTLLVAIPFLSFKMAINNPIDKTTFKENFLKIFEAAKTRFANEFGKEEAGFKHEKYTKKYESTLNMDGASTSMVIDGENIKSYKIEYSFKAATLDEAKEVKKETSDLLKTIVPSDYKSKSSYVPGYAGYMCDFFEYNSDIFAEVSKKPVVRVGIILEEEGKYILEILVSEPVFKTSEK